MRLSHSLIFAGSLCFALPALAQDQPFAPTNATTSNATGQNMAAAPAEPVAANTPAAAPTGPETAQPATTAMPADSAPATDRKPSRGFPWGVLGLVGLIGLFGVRKIKG